MDKLTNKDLKKQLESLRANIGKSWVGDDHIYDKIDDIEQELNRRELKTKTK